LQSMESAAQDGRARITLEFSVGQDMDKALLLVSNRLDQVTDYPDEAGKPTLNTSGSEDNPIAWFRVVRMEGNDKPIHTFGKFAEDVIQERLERVPGVGGVDVYGGSERQMRITVDPARMARYGLTIPLVIDKLRAANASISGGDVEEGKRRYVVRTEGEFETTDQVAAVVLRTLQDPQTGRLGRVTVGDIADVEFGYSKPTSTLRANGRPAIGMPVTREIGANVIETMAGIRQAVRELNSGPLVAAGLKMEQVYDETTYINSAIDLVTQNIWVGGVLAVIILMLFLRSARATLVIALAIPVSVVASFVAMAALGRSLNVVSLAGIAFAVGMVVDAAIVVLENIYRLRQQGRPALTAAYDGAKQVWGAILVSALTTVMVFIPVMVMKLEVGQLFRDIAVAISVAVVLSLVVSITVIPALSRRLLQHDVGEPGAGVRLFGFDQFAHGFMLLLLGLTRAVVRSKTLALVIVVLVTLTTGFGTWRFLPALEYLPEGNRNFVFGSIQPPPGYNLGTMTAIAERTENAVRPDWASETGPESAPGEPPKMDSFFFVAFRSNTIIGASSVDPARARELIPVIRKPVLIEPGTTVYVRQPSIFGRGIGGTRSVDLDVAGGDLETILDVARNAYGKVTTAMPLEAGNQVRLRPGLELGAPEIRVIPNPVRLADNGVSARELGLTVDAFNDGLRVAEITVDGQRIDLVLMGPENNVMETQGIAALPVVTRSGAILTAGALSDVVMTSGPTEIRHSERSRAVTLQITPAPRIALGNALETIQSEVIDSLYEEGLPAGVKLRMSGTADKLAATWTEMKFDLLIALAIVYLVMAVLFESFVYPLIIVLSVPLATAGGVAGLNVLGMFHFQALDMLTLLGFVILIGIVVNNAILLVHQTLYLIREDAMGYDTAIVEATRNRVRPIFMSSLTSVFGMLPLVLFPGAGSEIYRGLGSVVVGGLALSALLTLTIIPPLLSLFLGVLEGRSKSDDRDSGVAELPKAAE
ncbi:MAG: efflux RND transporter permease subunit, partial [Alphaproteobacteria bacterium]|nr:efflux RND transporter permease subunit [Alphaproteobacteria bacterium]